MLIFLLTRLLILMFGNSEVIIGDSEFSRGTIAKEIIEGRSWPLLAYQNAPHEGGSLVAGIVAVPFLLLFGNNLIALKLVALLFSLGSFTLFYWFLVKYFNRGIAIMASLFLIFGPINFVMSSIETLGSHYDSIFFTILALILLFKILFEKDSYLKNYYTPISLFGLVCGFGVYFTYTFLVTLATCLLFWFLLDKAIFFRKKFYIFLLFFTIGLTPWFFYNVKFHFLGLEINTEPILRHFSFSNFASRSVFFFVEYLPNALKYSNKHYISYPIYLLFILLFCFEIWRNMHLIRRLIFGQFRKEEMQFYSNELKEIAVLLFPFIFFLAYNFSDFQNAPGEGGERTVYKYMYPYVFFIFLIVTLGINKVLAKLPPWLKKPTISMIIFIIVSLTSLNIASSISFGNFKNHLKQYRGYSYYLLGCNVMKFTKGNIDLALEYLNKINEKYRLHAYRGYVNDLSLKYINGYGYQKFFDRVPHNFWNDLYICLGMGIAERKEWSLLSKIDSSYLDYCIEGIGIYAGSENRIEDYLPRISKKDMPSYYKGVGSGVLWMYRDNMKKAFDFSNNVAEEYRRFYNQGLRKGLDCIDYYSFDREKFAELENQFISSPYNIFDSMGAVNIKILDQIEKTCEDQFPSYFNKRFQKAAKGNFGPTDLKDVNECFSILINPGVKFLDIGSWDGRVVFLASLYGAEAFGIEYDPTLYQISNMAMEKLKDIINIGDVKFIKGDAYLHDFSNYDIFYLFGNYIKKLEKKYVTKVKTVQS